MDVFMGTMGTIATILGIWGALGVGAKALGIAPTVKEGMKKVANGVAKECGISTNQENLPTYAVDEWEIRSLTEMLKPFFDFIIYESAFFGAYLLKIVYRCGQLNVGLDVVELTFRNFLKAYYNLPSNAPLCTWVYIWDGHLYLFCAFSDEAKAWLQTQKNNARSRQIPNDSDLTE